MTQVVAVMLLFRCISRHSDLAAAVRQSPVVAPIWPGLTWSVLLQGLPVSFILRGNKDVSSFLHAEPRPGPSS